MKKVLKNSLTMILVIAMLCGLCPVKPSFAAANRKCYTISSGNTTVYSNTGLTRKKGYTTCTRPGGSSYGYISKGDQVMVLGTSGNYTQVKYPVSGGYKYAFVTKANADKYIINNSSNKQPSTGTTKLSYGL